MKLAGLFAVIWIRPYLVINPDAGEHQKQYYYKLRLTLVKPRDQVSHVTLVDRLQYEEEGRIREEVSY